MNTPRTITNQSKQKRWEWNSDPFGTTLVNENPASLGVFTFNLRFSGQYFDKETGNHYNYHRDYDPLTGRYIQSDPIGLNGGLNTYAYATTNPLTYADPDGLLPRCSSEILRVIRKDMERTEFQVVRSGYGVGAERRVEPGPDLPPNRRPRFGRVSPPIKPQLNMEVWWYRWEEWRFRLYKWVETFHDLRVYCSETSSDSCGRTQTRSLAPFTTTEKIHTSPEQFVREWREERKRYIARLM